MHLIDKVFKCTFILQIFKKLFQYEDRLFISFDLTFNYCK
jgi:hypothetical protein